MRQRRPPMRSCAGGHVRRPTFRQVWHCPQCLAELHAEQPRESFRDTRRRIRSMREILAAGSDAEQKAATPGYVDRDDAEPVAGTRRRGTIAKLEQLAERGATEHERAAARAKLERLRGTR